MGVRTRIALGTLCMANMATFVALGVVALLYVDGAAGPIASATLWLAAFGLDRKSVV